MDQRVVAGVGNVYRSEVLFRHRLDPYLPGRALDATAWEGIWSDVVTLMRAGLRSGRIITTDPVDRSRRTGPVRGEDAHYVYRRTGLPCRIDGTPITMQVLAARKLYWCPTCQADVTSERGFDRLVNFSDAVVAIAISLLILPVVDAVTDISDETGVDFFAENGSRLIAFVVSFVVIAKFWLVHHSLFEKVVSYTQPILIANFVWLISIVFIPLPTEMLGEHGVDDAFVRFVYCGSLFVSSASIVLRRLAHPAQPGDVEGPVRARARGFERGLMTSVMFLVATVIAVTVPADRAVGPGARVARRSARPAPGARAPPCLTSSCRAPRSSTGPSPTCACGTVASTPSASSPPTPGDETLDLHGYLLSPAPVEPHAHLDKAFLAERVTNRTGDLLGAVEAMVAARGELGVEDTIERAERAARLLAANGFAAVRSHADTTMDHGLRSIEALAEVRRRVADVIDVQVVALCGWPIAGAGSEDQRALLRRGTCRRSRPRRRSTTLRPGRLAGRHGDAAADRRRSWRRRRPAHRRDARPAVRRALGAGGAGHRRRASSTR